MSDQAKDGGPAFPLNWNTQKGAQAGLSKRELIAMVAMHAFIVGQNKDHREERLDGILGFSKIRVASYAAADEMLKGQS